jgi:hypothetical protein
MNEVQRFDYSSFEAKKTDEGFLVDSPIVARIGIQEYVKADGTIRRELRLPEDVFSTDSLESMRGKPVTVEHPASGKVTSKDAHRVAIGSILAAGRQDGDNVRTDITIFTPDSIGDRRELSLGYTAILDETPGEWNGQKYDAIQRSIKINHLSVVKRGRAGVARLNMDSNEEVFINQQEQQTMSMVKVKLDSGLEYDAAPEVSAELNKLRADALGFAEKLNAIPKLEAERDTLKSRVDGIGAELETATANGKSEALARIQLDTVAAKFKIDAKDKTDREVKEAVIMAVRKDAVLAEKSDVYIDAAFDMAVEAAPAAAMASQRKDALTIDPNTKTVTSKDAHRTYLDALANLHKEQK